VPTKRKLSKTKQLFGDPLQKRRQKEDLENQIDIKKALKNVAIAMIYFVPFLFIVLGAIVLIDEVFNLPINVDPIRAVVSSLFLYGSGMLTEFVRKNYATASVDSD
jgi:hypothetical protein